MLRFHRTVCEVGRAVVWRDVSGAIAHLQTGWKAVAGFLREAGRGWRFVVVLVSAERHHVPGKGGSEAGEAEEVVLGCKKNPTSSELGVLCSSRCLQKSLVCGCCSQVPSLKPADENVSNQGHPSSSRQSLYIYFLRTRQCTSCSGASGGV